MARTLYDKPTRALLKDMLSELGLKPGQVFTTARAIQWFQERYPKVKPGSVRAHLVQASTNDRSRLYHTSTNATDDLLFKVAPAKFRLYEPDKDPAPIHELVDSEVARQELHVTVDKIGGVVALKLQVEKGNDRALNQLLTHMDWVRKQLAEPGQRVRGIIVCRTLSEDLRVACSSIPDVQLLQQQFSVPTSAVCHSFRQGEDR